MKPKRLKLKYWQRYVDDLKGPMRLGDWRITVKEFDPNDDDTIGNEAGAGIRASDNYKTADLVLGRDWLAYDAETQREYLVHELTHLHLWHYMKHCTGLADRLGTEARDIAYGTANHLLESTNDELARTIAPFLPLPPERKEKAA